MGELQRLSLRHGGRANAWQFSAPQKDLLNWMDQRKVNLSSGERPGLLPSKRTRFPSALPLSMHRQIVSYWLEYRQAVDYSSGLPAEATDGVMVRLKDANLAPGASTGLNMLGTRPSDGLNVDSATIRSGESWTTPEGFRLTLGSVSATGAHVNVTPPGEIHQRRL